MAEENPKTFHYGGQAVIEGVMMRGPKDFAVAVRKANGEIVTTREDVESVMGRFKWLDKPFLRGTLALIDSMALGIKALKYSADIAMADAVEADAKTGAAKAGEPAGDVIAEQSTQDVAPKKSGVNDATVGAVMVLGLVAGLALFFFLPIVITKPLGKMIHVPWGLTAIEGLVKVSIFVGYVLLISLMKDIRRVFQYHGAEHKTINAYEAKVDLTTENVLNHTKEHVRCGTSFILVVLMCSIIVFVLVADHLPHGSLTERTFTSYWVRWLYKLALLPLVAGIAYEVIKYAGRHKDSLLARALVFPGLLMQKITTREPEPAMIEVAIRSLQGVLDYEATREEEAQAEAV